MNITFGEQKDKLIEDLVAHWNAGKVLSPSTIEGLIKGVLKGLVSGELLSRTRIVWESFLISHSYVEKYGYQSYFSFMKDYVKKPSDFSIKVNKLGSVMIVIEDRDRIKKAITHQQVMDDILCILSSLVVYDNYHLVTVHDSVNSEELVRCFSEKLYGYDACSQTGVSVFFFPDQKIYYMNGQKRDIKVVMSGDRWIVIEMDEGYISLLV